MTSFGKLEVTGRRWTCSSASAATGSTGPSARSSTRSSLDERGGIVGDVTVTRLAEDRFRVVTGAGAVDTDRGFLELHGGGDVTIGRHRRLGGDRDLGARGARGARLRHRATTSRATRSRSGPRRRSSRRWSGPRAADHVRRRVRLRALRRAASGASHVWDALDGDAAPPEPVGYQALDSLRIEKGYRYFGTDLTRAGHAVRGRASASASATGQAAPALDARAVAAAAHAARRRPRST